jgi:hypothetical protein
MPVVLVPISMNAREIEDEQTLEVITRMVPTSDKRGGATIDLSEKVNAEWATYRTRSSLHDWAQVWNVQPGNQTDRQVV